MAIQQFDLPPWLQQKDSPWAAMVAGYGVAQDISQNMMRARALTLEAQRMQSQDDLAHKKFELDAQSVGLQNQIQTQQIEAEKNDQPLWIAYQDKLYQAQSTSELAAMEMPAFQSDKTRMRAVQELNGRAHLLSQTSAGMAMAKLDAKYDDVIDFDPNAMAQLGQFKRYSPEWATALDDWSTTANDVRSRKAQADYAEKQRILTEGKIAVQTERGQQQLMNIDERGLWGGYQKSLGGRAPNKDTFLRGSVHDILEKDSRDRKVLIDQGKPSPPPMTYEEAVGLAESVWNKNITPQDSTKSSAPKGKVLKWNPDTNDFE